MRRTSRFSLIVLALALAAPGFLRAQAQPTVDDIVAKNLKAKGGAEKLKSMQSMQMSGTATVQGMEVAMTIYSKRPNMMRQDLKVQDKAIVQAFDGTTVWMVNPLMGSDTPQELTGPQADSMKDQADFDGTLTDYKAKGHTIELVGTEDVDGRKAYHLSVTKKNGQIQHYYLDADSGIELRVTTTIDQGGQPMTIASDLSNYQEVNGIMLPFSMKQSMNGTPLAQMTIEKAEFNVPLDDSLFKMPVKK